MVGLKGGEVFFHAADYTPLRTATREAGLSYRAEPCRDSTQVVGFSG